MSISRDTKRVLVLDSDGPARERLAAALVELGLSPSYAGSAREALERLHQEPAGFALLLAERACGGLELLEQTPTAPMLLLDSFGSAQDAARARELGAFEVLARPLAPELLQAACSRALASAALSAENERLRGGSPFDELDTRDPAMQAVLELAARVADSRASLLIQGESGTGKTRLARAIHGASARSDAAFIEVNCGALPADLLMSELFGHVRGAFTGAERDRVGKFEAADGGTLFLDEIACASPDLQVKLLRVLESSRFERVGDNQTIEVDVRVLAACNQSLPCEVDAGRFRADLYWRLKVVELELPPLRQRPGDLIELAEQFRARFAARHERKLGSLDPLCQALLLAHDWPGNVRELENAIERAVLFSRGPGLTPEDFDPALLEQHHDSSPARTGELMPAELEALASAPPGPLKAALEGPERFLLRRALEACQGNRQRTAGILDINRSTLFNKMRKHGLLDFPTDLAAPAALANSDCSTGPR